MGFRIPNRGVVGGIWHSLTFVVMADMSAGTVPDTTCRGLEPDVVVVPILGPPFPWCPSHASEREAFSGEADMGSHASIYSSK